VFERFTEDARQVVVLAQHEAREPRHPGIGTEHLLLGMVREGDGVAAREDDRTCPRCGAAWRVTYSVTWERQTP
jgi:ATP-dependent Clp protease ATP-binding subunit ClpA